VGGLVKSALLLYIVFVIWVLTAHFTSLKFYKESWFPFRKVHHHASARVVALDAENGNLLWKHNLPPLKTPAFAGDEELLLQRWAKYELFRKPGEVLCSPTSPAPHASVTADGNLYTIADADGNGLISDKEIGKVNVGHAFQGAPAMAPGMMAVLPCGGGLWVWQS